MNRIRHKEVWAMVQIDKTRPVGNVDCKAVDMTVRWKIREGLKVIGVMEADKDTGKVDELKDMIEQWRTELRGSVCIYSEREEVELKKVGLSNQALLG